MQEKISAIKNKKYFANTTKRASRTFYVLTLAFPKNVREDVFVLYTFLRRADDLIDAKIFNESLYLDYKKETYKAYNKQNSSDFALNAFGLLCLRTNIEINLVNSFFESLEIDLNCRSYSSYEDLLKFVYGVAEVVGIMMAKVMKLPEKAYDSARLLGRGMQLTNIIRDVKEDAELKRLYIPQDDLNLYKVDKVVENGFNKENINLKNLIKAQCQRAIAEIEKSREGFIFIPKKYLYTIKTSADIYFWVLNTIYNDPMIIFKQKVRPPIYLILSIFLKNFFSLNFSLNIKHHETRI